jgi:hypothetical protein
MSRLFLFLVFSAPPTFQNLFALFFSSLSTAFIGRCRDKIG